MSKGKILTTVAAVSVAAMMTVDVYAAGWQHNMTGWWYGTNEANTTWHANGWQWIDGNNDGIAECYCFNQNGYMLASTITPDGFTVNADGAWTVNGVVQTKSCKRIQRHSIRRWLWCNGQLWWRRQFWCIW